MGEWITRNVYDERYVIKYGGFDRSPINGRGWWAIDLGALYRQTLSRSTGIGAATM
jgi:hypothetical protein